MSKEQLAKVNEYRKNKKYTDEKAAKAKRTRRLLIFRKTARGRFFVRRS